MRKAKRFTDWLVAVMPVGIISVVLLLLAKKKRVNRNEWSVPDRIELYIWSHIRKWPLYKIKNLRKYTRLYTLSRLDTFSGAEKLVETQGGNFTNYLPAINRVCEGGEISYHFENQTLYRLRNASFIIESDFIRSGDITFAEKMFRKDAEILLPEDLDFVAMINKDNVILRNKVRRLYLKNVFHFTGVLSGFWSHFLISFFSKLHYLESIKDQNVDIVIPYKLDSNIVDLIREKLVGLDNFSIREVDHDTEIFCEVLYTVNLNSYILCHSKHNGPYGVQISELTAKFLKKSFSSEPLPTNLFLNNRKLFIGRRGGRNIRNYNEVLAYFEAAGFVEILPHTLTLAEKRKIFSSAEMLAGPYSSGFTNLVYCRPGTRILAFVNYARCYDTYMATLSKIFDCDFQFCLGKDTDGGINADYSIDIEEVNSIMKKKNIYAGN